jgi:hypothetical protein
MGRYFSCVWRKCTLLCGLALAPMTLFSFLPVWASVTCAVRQQGQTTITYFCEDGFTCDMPNKKCLPGPARLKAAQKILDEAAQNTYNFNRDQIAQRSATEARAFGYAKGQTYYLWNGDPKEMPTPRYRPRFTLAPGTSASRQATIQRRQQQVSRNVGRTQPVATRIVVLLNAALQYQPRDPNRVNIVKTARKFVRDNKIPLDIDEFLACGDPTTVRSDSSKSYQLRWRVPDIIPEIEKRGLCDKAKDDEKKEACQKEQFGLVIMSVEPDIRALCKLQENDFQETDMQALGECAERKFKNAWALRDGAVPAAQTENALDQGRNCQPLTSDKLDDLRKRLRVALNKAGVPEDDEIATTSPGVPSPEVPPQAEIQPADLEHADIDEAFCAYIAYKSVRGELTPGGGAAIPAYCRTAVEDAKSCQEQKCSMADIVVEQEKRTKTNALPWGSADQEAITALTRTVE